MGCNPMLLLINHLIPLQLLLFSQMFFHSKPCEGVSLNLQKSFKFDDCPEGFISDGRKGGNCCHPKDQVVWRSFPVCLAVIIVLAPALTSTWILWIHKKKKLVKHRAGMFKQNGGELLLKKLSKPKRKTSASTLMRIYTAEDMMQATSNYSSVMHRCKYGTFYHGILADDNNSSSNNNTEVAVMKIQEVPESQIKQFIDQLIFFSQPHRNLVKIIGCCLETVSPLLVYELHGDGTGTLSNHIYDEGLLSLFSCEMRVKAAAGAARALAYLHSHNSRAKLVHGDISSACILLDDSYNAKLFYAIASSLIPRDIRSLVQENCVYKDPEFYSSGQLNEKGDVYSFGVVLAELLTGGKAKFAPDRQENDRNFAQDFVSLVKENRLPEIIDGQLITEGDDRLVKEVAMLAARCLSGKSDERPNMKEVEAKLSALMQ